MVEVLYYNLMEPLRIRAITGKIKPEIIKLLEHQYDFMLAPGKYNQGCENFNQRQYS